MIALGGVTRLTRSGLSITEWKPVTGMLPPLSEESWELEFSKYQESPEYKILNSHFTISDYKKIFLWEYLHRLLGRFIFLFTLIPGILLWRKKEFSGYKVSLLCSMIALQGLIGWLMVKSGLQRDPMVSPYMLSLHFFSALSVLVIAYVFLLQSQSYQIISRAPKAFFALGTLISVQIFYGCLTAGWKAGFMFNTYPMMSGHFFPESGFIKSPLWVNFFSNHATVQWTHRWLAMIVFAGILFLLILKDMKPYKKSLWILLFFVFLQIILGILTIVFIVPVSLGVMHQAVACLIVLSFVKIIFSKPEANEK